MCRAECLTLLPPPGRLVTAHSQLLSTSREPALAPASPQAPCTSWWLKAGGRAPPEKVIRKLKMPPCSEGKGRGPYSQRSASPLCSGGIRVGLPAAMLFKHGALWRADRWWAGHQVVTEPTQCVPTGQSGTMQQSAAEPAAKQQAARQLPSLGSMLSVVGDRQTNLKWSLVRPKNAGSPQEPARKACQSAGTELGWQRLPAHGRARAECNALTGCRRW